MPIHDKRVGETDCAIWGAVTLLFVNFAESQGSHYARLYALLYGHFLVIISPCHICAPPSLQTFFRSLWCSLASSSHSWFIFTFCNTCLTKPTSWPLALLYPQWVVIPHHTPPRIINSFHGFPSPCYFVGNILWQHPTNQKEPLSKRTQLRSSQFK